LGGTAVYRMQSIPLDNISTVDAAPSSDSARRSTKSEKVVTSNDVEDASPNHNTSVSQEPLVPNGGYGWICVACIFFLNSHTWGINSVRCPLPISQALSTSTRSNC
jgi:hypothetical protein